MNAAKSQIIKYRLNFAGGNFTLTPDEFCDSFNVIYAAAQLYCSGSLFNKVAIAGPTEKQEIQQSGASYTTPDAAWSYRVGAMFVVR